jgi:hypothetical protein
MIFGLWGCESLQKLYQQQSSYQPQPYAQSQPSTRTDVVIPSRLKREPVFRFGEIWNRYGAESGAFDLEAARPVPYTNSAVSKDLEDQSSRETFGITGFAATIGTVNGTRFQGLHPEQAQTLANSIDSASAVWNDSYASDATSVLKRDDWYLLRTSVSRGGSFYLFHVLEVDVNAGTSKKGNTGVIRFEFAKLEN